MMKYTRLYSGKDDHSYFEEVDITHNEPVNHALLGEAYYLSDSKKVMMGHLHQQAIDWHHPPGRVFVIYLEGYQECRYLVKDSGTSESPKSTHQRGKYFSLDCPASDIFALTAPGKMSSQ